MGEIELKTDKAENRKRESQEQMIVIKRQRKTIEEEKIDQLPRRTLEDAYMCS